MPQQPGRTALSDLLFLYTVRRHHCKFQCVLSVLVFTGVLSSLSADRGLRVAEAVRMFGTPLLLGVVKLLICGYCDSSVREKDWCCRKRGPQAMRARHAAAPALWAHVLCF